ncbi:TonB-dependent receptor [Sphingopyxis sp. R3-92]|uniref:TonB-dependent receptor n=1 Tax=Sphingopyxis sp. R3-92 TaxID=3158553 RepID=UPI003EE51FC5
MDTSLMRAMLLATASVAMVATAAPTAAYAQEAKFQIDIPAQSMGNALLALGKATKQNIVFNGSLVKGKRSAAVRGRLRADEALEQMLRDSGLKMARGSGGGLVVQAGNGGAKAAEAVGNGILVGAVRDHGTGSALKGALVEIVETGEKTSTGDLGDFRFSRVPAGVVMLRISYLGFPEQSETVAIVSGVTNAADIYLGGGATTEIVVYGQTSARAQSLNQERAADNTRTVLSADLLGQFNGTTVSESLRRAPGVAFTQDPITGNGANVIVRGMAPDLNTVTINGLRLPEGSGTGRSASLGNILTDSISKITINKTLLASQDSTGTGGLVEIETKGPLDRPRRYFNVTVQKEALANDFRDGVLLSGTASAKFGASEQFGLSASVQYRKQDIERFSYTANADYLTQYLPLDANGQPIPRTSFIPPTTMFPFEPEASDIYPGSVSTSYNGAKTRNLTITLSAQAKLGDHTDLKFDYIRASDKRDVFSSFLSTSTWASYELMPIDEFGGELRYALVSEDLLADFAPGSILAARQTYNFADDVEELTTSYSFRGTSKFGGLSLDYSAGMSTGSLRSPFTSSMNLDTEYFNGLPRSMLSPEALVNVTSDGRVVHLYAPMKGRGLPLPLLNDAGFAYFNNLANYPYLNVYALAGDSGMNRRYSGKFDATYEFSTGPLRSVSAGVFFERAKFQSRPSVTPDRYEVLGTGANLADLGLNFADNALAPLGIAKGFNTIDSASARAFLASIPSLMEGLNPNGLSLRKFGAQDPRLQQTFTTEENLAAYVQANFEIGKLTAVAGVRFDRVKLGSRNLYTPQVFDEDGNFITDIGERFSTLYDDGATQSKFLPRLALTYRAKENLLFRAAYTTAVARPVIANLSSQQILNIFLAPTGGPLQNQPTVSVYLGNPALKSSFTRAFDVGAEWYFEDVGQFKVSGFYKDINNPPDSAVTIVSIADADQLNLPDDPRLNPLPGNTYIELTQPSNSDETAKIYGVEVAFEKKLGFLPGLLSGLGVYANYTYTNSSRTISGFYYFDPVTGERINTPLRGISFSGDPRHSGTAALTYTKHGVDATLAFTQQGRRLNQTSAFDLSRYDEADSTLDFRAQYQFDIAGGTARVWLEGSDLLKGKRSPDVEQSFGSGSGVKVYGGGGNFYGGRMISVGASVSF